ncbi:MAG: amidohydrolase [Coriobacteriales bacterium]|jgi:5-methylthioadenosine/S-adenosylhomocysteine deaminase|nr:amidohydrolase [Coriobacteriales bacterium]
MFFKDIDYLAPDFSIQHGDVLVEGKVIRSVGPAAGVPGSGEVVSGSGKLLIPGLYNCHTHIPMTLLRGYAEGLPLQSWLNDKVFPFEAKIKDPDAYYASQLAVAEMLRFGTVSFSDMYDYSDQRAQVVLESGIKANLCNGFTVFDDRGYEETPYYEIDKHMVADYHGAAAGRLKVELNIHAEYTTTPKVVEAVGEAALAYGVGTHIHLSETKAEHEECKQRHGGLTPAAYFDSLGFFRQPCICAHCVWVTPEDIELLQARGATAVLNPASNMKLGSGFAPVGEMLAAGLNVALGSDGVASNNSHNLFKDLYLLAIAYKGANHDPLCVSPAEALAAATVNGAAAQGRATAGQDRDGQPVAPGGQIAPGYAADLCLLDVSGPWMQPATNLLNNLVYSAQGTDVLMTMVDGQVLYDRRGLDAADPAAYKTIDVEKAAAETAAATQRILSAL